MRPLKSLLDVVSIGGGNGLACLLKGLKHGVVELPVVEPQAARAWISRLTAVVTVTDDGGSSGRLRDELKMPPPGDIRNCLVALSADESLLSQLFQYRFPGSGGLEGHSFGNLFLTALKGITGDFLESIRLSSDVLAIRGRIFPSTLQDVRLEATLENGRQVRGESAISASEMRIKTISLRPEDCRPVPAVLEAIRRAHIITVGPGSLYTSLLPNLLVRGIPDAMRRSKALKIYIANLMTQPGETTGYTAAQHLEAIHLHAGPKLFDMVVLNRKPVGRTVLARYRRQGATPVVSDRSIIEAMGPAVFEEELLARERVIRHDPDLLAAAVLHAYESWKAPGHPRRVEVKSSYHEPPGSLNTRGR